MKAFNVPGSAILGMKDNRYIPMVIVGLVVLAMAQVLAGRSSEILILLPIVLVGVAASVRYPMIALATLTAIIFSNASQNLIVEFGLPSIAKLAVPGMIMLFMLRFLVLQQVPYVGAFAALFLLSVFGMKLVSAMYAYDGNRSMFFADAFLRDIAFALLALGFLAHTRSLETIVKAVVTTTGLICALWAYQAVFGRDPGGFYGFSMILENSDRFSGPLLDANFFGSIIVFSIPLSLFLFLNAPRLSLNILWGGVAILLVLGLLATNSRGSLLGMIVGLCVFSLGLTLRQGLWFLGSLAGAGLIAVLAINPETFAHFQTIIGFASSGGELADKSTEGRLASWAVAMALFKENPILGVGVGNFNLFYQDRALELGLIFRGEGRSTHSLYLEFLAEQGIVGLSFFLFTLGVAAWSIVSGARLARRSNDVLTSRMLLAFGAGLAGYMFAMTFLQDSFPRALWFVIALALEARFFVMYHQRNRARVLGVSREVSS